jgi:hypothetical protein
VIKEKLMVRPKEKNERHLGDFLWPLAATLLSLVVVRVLFAQYAQFFSENEWLLPASVVLVIALWLLPLFLHQRAIKIYRRLVGIRRIGPAIVIVLSLLVTSTFYIGGGWLLRLHRRHLAAIIEAQKPHTAPVAITQNNAWMTNEFLGTIYWIRFTGSKTITPINVVVNYTVTNIKPTPIMIKHLSLEILGTHDTWWTMNNLPALQAIWMVDRKYPIGVSLITLPDGFLTEKLANTEITPGQSVSGWLLCQLPAEYVPLRDFMSTKLRLRIIDTANDEAVQPVETPTFRDNVLRVAMQFTPVSGEDIRSYKIIPYGE